MISSRKMTSPGSPSSVGWDRVGGSGFVTSSVEIVLVVLEEPALVRFVLGFLLLLGVVLNAGEGCWVTFRLGVLLGWGREALVLGRALQGGVTLRVISG